MVLRFCENVVTIFGSANQDVIAPLVGDAVVEFA
jgi:hypothetical protein